jgi:hypothetical protein
MSGQEPDELDCNRDEPKHLNPDIWSSIQSLLMKMQNLLKQNGGVNEVAFNHKARVNIIYFEDLKFVSDHSVFENRKSSTSMPHHCKSIECKSQICKSIECTSQILVFL